MPIPPHRAIGDSGHTADHADISDKLSEHDQQIAMVTPLISSVCYITGNNNFAFSDQSTYAFRIALPAGARDAAVEPIAVLYNGKKTGYLDGYGHVRSVAATAGSVPLVARGTDSQTADLQQWQGADGTSLARVDKAGNIAATNLNPLNWNSNLWGSWNPVSLKSGYVAHDASVSGGFGFVPSYKVKPSGQVELRGTIAQSGGGPFTTSGATLATLPLQYAPAQQVSGLVASGTGTGSMWSVRMDVMPTGEIIIRITGGYAGSGSTQGPGWVTLDGIHFDIPPLAATTPIVDLPVKPTGLTANTVTSTAATLTWSPVSGATGYRMYRGDTLIAAPSSTPYQATGLAPGQSYSFTVSAVNAAGEGPRSASVTVTTPSG